MRRNLTIALAGALALTAVAAGEAESDPTTISHPCYDETLEEIVYADTQGVFFHESSAKLGNAADPAGWDENEPASSVQSGGGAMTLSSAVALGDTAEEYPTQEAVFVGVFDGCIDMIAVDLFSFDATNRSGTGGTATPANHNFGLSILVDGYEVFSGGPLEATTTLGNEGFGPNLNRFALDLGSAIETYSRYYPLAIDGEHDIELRIGSWYANTGHSAYLWDSTEVPSGITFNADDLEGYSVVG
ncbi:MAG: hypothetical protein ACJA2F_000040 [Nitriliruptoraceae bacterium]|jgi:hypothetical protein